LRARYKFLEQTLIKKKKYKLLRFLKKKNTLAIWNLSLEWADLYQLKQ